MIKHIFLTKRRLVFFLVLVAVLSGVTAGAIVGFTHDLPQIRSLETYAPSATTRIFSGDGLLLAELYVEKRDYVPLHQMPAYLKSALTATEDRQFYLHNGVDLKGILRAMVKNILAGKFVEGASTITQQLAKNLFLTPRKTLDRKIREAILALQLERRYTKDEILEKYLNLVYFGSGAYGAESAAQIYFGKSVKDLSVSECALIAGMPKSPSRYSPLVNPDLARWRRNIVLKQMRDTRVISESQYQKAKNRPLNLKPPKPRINRSPYFIEFIKSRLEEKYGSKMLYREGLTVHTTLSGVLQQTAEKALEKGLIQIKKRMRKKNLLTQDPEGAIVSIDIETGAILAMAGGTNFSKTPFNRAVHAKRQPGSAFKPILYAYAIENGYSQNMTLLDAPTVFGRGKNGKDWKPRNFSRTYSGEITLRKALVRSRNIPAVRLMEKMSPSAVAGFAGRMGIDSNLKKNLSLALGTSEMTLMELTGAYTVFPNKGVKIEPYGVTEIFDRNSNSIYRAKPRKKAVLSRAGAAIMCNMLQGVVQNGTGKRARVIHHPLGGKTGTTDENKDAWFIGFSPSIAAGVWIGQDDNSSLGRGETGAKAALPVWIDFMKKAVEIRPNPYFDIPDDVVKLPFDPETGKTDANSSDRLVVGLFKKKDHSRKLENRLQQ